MRRTFLLPVVGLFAAACSGEEPPAEASRATVLTEAPAGAGAVHVVRLVSRADRYGFEPDLVRIRPGDVVRFVHTGYQPESIAFDSAGAEVEPARFLADHDLLTGPLLTEPGATFDVHFDGAPAGEYWFYSPPHRAAGMEGQVVVEP